MQRTDPDPPRSTARVRGPLKIRLTLRSRPLPDAQPQPFTHRFMGCGQVADLIEMSKRPKVQQVGDQKAREKVAERVGRPVNAIGLVRPRGNGTAGKWLGGTSWFIGGDFLSNAAVEVATIGLFERR